MRDLNEANVVEALAEVGGPPAVLTCAPGVPELIAKRICLSADTLVEGVDVRVDVWATGWKLEKTDG